MISVVCALIQDEAGRYLIAKRPEGKALAGCWEFPGGKLERGESLEEALCRELKEELLIEIAVFQVLDAVEHHYEKFSIRLIPCQARILSGVPTPIEHPEIAWVRIEDMDLDSLAPADVPILSQLVGK